MLFALHTAARGQRPEAFAQAAALVREGSRDADLRILHAEEHLTVQATTMNRLHEGLEGSTDRLKVQRAMGRYLLRGAGDPKRAADLLAGVVRERPWDRDARLLLVAARRRTGREGDLARAIDEARGLRLEDPADYEATLAFAEALAERGNALIIRSEGASGLSDVPFVECIALYDDLAARPAPDLPTAIRVLQGLARAHMSCIPADPPEAPTAPTTHYRRCVAALERAEALDPKGEARDAHGRRLLADTCYLRGKAAKWTHAGAKDHTEAPGWYEKAIATDHLHLEATWDLGLLYYDLFRTAEYVRKAVDLWERHMEERHRRGLPPLEAKDMKYVVHARALAARGEGFPAGMLTPELPTPPR